MKRWLRVSTVASVLAATGVGFAAPASAAGTIVVRPGQSIQAAVNRAAVGSTILLEPGVYRESVLVRKNRLNIRGSGAAIGGTVLQPGANTRQPCDSGICVVGTKAKPVEGVSVSSLLARNYPGNGVIAFWSTNLIVQNVVAQNNGEYGVARFNSTGGSLITNVASGSGEAGLYIGDSPHANAFVAGNEVYGNLFGIFFRHSQHAVFENNYMHDNCAGLLALSAPKSPPGGNAVVRGNVFLRNNKFCPGGEESPPIGGVGIALAGSQGMTVTANTFLNNSGDTPFSGGIVLINGSDVGSGPTKDNTIVNNSAFRDAPADIVDMSGRHNVFRNNHCTASLPSGLCH